MKRRGTHLFQVSWTVLMMLMTSLTTPAAFDTFAVFRPFARRTTAGAPNRLGCFEVRMLGSLGMPGHPENPLRPHM